MRVVKALPKHMVVELQSVSDKALAYMGKDALKHKFLVIYELGGIGRPGSDALEMVKQGMSEGCIRRQIAESTNKGVRPKLVEVDGPMNVWTTTRVKTDYALNNRVFELTSDDSRDQTQQILERVFADDRPPVDLGPVQALFTWLAGQDNRVVLPFGPALGKLLPSSSVCMRREAPRVRNLICAHAALHQANRERDERGRIVATLEDYETVRAGRGIRRGVLGATPSGNQELPRSNGVTLVRSGPGRPLFGSSTNTIAAWTRTLSQT
jgi:type II secretory pathway component PulJ